MENKKLLKFMTFNLRVDVKGDGINSFTNRFERVLDIINKEKKTLHFTHKKRGLWKLPDGRD